MPKKKQSYDFEGALKSLEQLVEQMESGDLSLENALETFEQGIQLTRECQTMLNEAELKVQKLVDNNGSLESQPFSPETSENQ
ncbi:MAG: exodeoxyribonuclease VII small subunit [Pseudomonadales bacterium]|jgi:exodeoxyribonuclease VII small subunit